MHRRPRPMRDRDRRRMGAGRRGRAHRRSKPRRARNRVADAARQAGLFHPRSENLKNFDACLKPLLEHEGGNDDDPQDPGGRTSRGIIQSEYDRYRARKGKPKRDVWTADDAEVDEIYQTEYWDAL